MSQGLPPIASRGVFSASASVSIDAPRHAVWQVLMDWASYREWNPFVRHQCLADAAGNPLSASQQAPRAGAHILMYPVHIPPSFDPPRWLPASSSFEVITVLDNDNYRCAWESVQFPSWLLTAERWQALVEVLEDGRTKTRYETVCVFGGVLAYPLWLVAGGWLNESFAAMGEGLKARSEGSH